MQDAQYHVKPQIDEDPTDGLDTPSVESEEYMASDSNIELPTMEIAYSESESASLKDVSNFDCKTVRFPVYSLAFNIH